MNNQIKANQRLDSLSRELFMLEGPEWVDEKTRARIKEIKTEIKHIERQAA